MVVRGGDLGRPLGVVQKKDLVGDLLSGRGIQIERHVIEPLHVPETLPVLRLLEMFRKVAVHIAFVIDEYGDFRGIATLNDVLGGIAGQMPEEHQPITAEIVRRPDGSWLVDGSAPIADLIEQLGLKEIEGEFHTAAGLALEQLARIPEAGEHFIVGHWRVEVIDMDGKRIDKLLFRPLEPSEAE